MNTNKGLEDVRKEFISDVSNHGMGVINSLGEGQFDWNWQLGFDNLYTHWLEVKLLEERERLRNFQETS